MIDLDLAAQQIQARIDSWEQRGLAVGPITWRDQGDGYPPVLKIDRSLVTDADSVGVRVGFADAEGDIVLFKGGWADFVFWSGDIEDDAILEAPGVDDALDVEEFGAQLDRLFGLFESTGNTSQSGVKSVTHEPPGDADFVLQVDLSVHGDMPGRSEQVWARRLGDTQFELRSIPFFADAMAPGDVLNTTGRYEIVSVERGSNQVLRIAVPRAMAEDFHERLHGAIVTTGLNHEWNGAGYVAVLLPTTQIPTSLHSLLKELEPSGLQYELATEEAS